jgi:hypothetical protein
MDYFFLISISKIPLALGLTLISIEYLFLNSKNDFKKIFNISPFLTLVFGTLFLVSCILLIAPSPHLWTLALLLHLVICHHFKGSFNGGSDFMLTQILIFHSLYSSSLENFTIKKYFLVYFCVQVLLSYFIAGFVKVKNRSWRKGLALGEILKIEKYDVPLSVKSKNFSTSVLKALSWGVMLWELSAFAPLLFPSYRVPFLALGLCFHLGNIYLFGLNRFLWVWISSYPLLYFFYVNWGLS